MNYGTYVTRNPTGVWWKMVNSINGGGMIALEYVDGPVGPGTEIT